MLLPSRRSSPSRGRGSPGPALQGGSGSPPAAAPWKPEAFKYHTASVIVSPETPDEEVIAKVRERVMQSGVDSLPLVLQPAAKAAVR